ncbi:hypothetical protein PENTCL1PPCAC_30442, partial [Pristionchus entomophagus]
WDAVTPMFPLQPGSLLSYRSSHSFSERSLFCSMDPSNGPLSPPSSLLSTCSALCVLSTLCTLNSTQWPCLFSYFK